MSEIKLEEEGNLIIFHKNIFPNCEAVLILEVNPIWLLPDEDKEALEFEDPDAKYKDDIYRSYPTCEVNKKTFIGIFRGWELETDCKNCEEIKRQIKYENAREWQRENMLAKNMEDKTED